MGVSRCAGGGGTQEKEKEQCLQKRNLEGLLGVRGEEGEGKAEKQVAVGRALPCDGGGGHRAA